MHMVTDNRSADIINGKIPVKEVSMEELQEMKNFFSEILKKLNAMIRKRIQFDEWQNTRK